MIIVGCCQCKQKTIKYSRVDGKKKAYYHKVFKIFGYEEGHFTTRYINGFQYLYYLAKVQKMRSHVCEYCGLRYRSNIKRCPNCLI